MCEVLDRIEARGEAIGEARGEARGREIGEARGKAIGREKVLLVSVKNLMKSTKWTAEQAMDAMGISADEQKELKSKLNL